MRPRINQTQSPAGAYSIRLACIYDTQLCRIRRVELWAIGLQHHRWSFLNVAWRVDVQHIKRSYKKYFLSMCVGTMQPTCTETSDLALPPMWAGLCRSSMLIFRFARRVSSACDGDCAEHLLHHSLVQSASLSRDNALARPCGDPHLVVTFRRHRNGGLGCKRDRADSEQDAE